MKKAAVLPALGIGDALLMMIASHQLQKSGYAVTTFHHGLPELSSWFPNHNIQPALSDDRLLNTLSEYDLIIVENDNSPRIKQLLNLLRPRLSVFYPTYLSTKHAPLSSNDAVFDSQLPMADNIARAVQTFTTLPLSKENGLTPLPSLTHRHKGNEVLIHPTSRDAKKNWSRSGFCAIALALKKRGLTPFICVSPSEALDWKWVEEMGISLICPKTLSDLAALVFESGSVIGNDSLTGHLASNLGVPTLIIANDKKRMQLWRPGWHEAELIFPPSFLPNWKCLRLKENYWQRFVTNRAVLRGFDKLLRTL
jgi:heptosyltransferase III